MHQYGLFSSVRTPRRRWRWFIWVCVLCVGLSVPILLHYQARPPVITLTSRSLTIDNPFYGRTFELSDVSKLELMQALPQVRVRTNGYAVGGTLRGWFSLDQLGDGKLFVEAGRPPYVAIFLRDGFVIVNYAESSDTERLYAALRAALAQRPTVGANSEVTTKH